jgi:hypothetical protein
MKNKNKEKVIEYESELESSFDLVLREAGELYQGEKWVRRKFLELLP